MLFAPKYGNKNVSQHSTQDENKMKTTTTECKTWQMSTIYFMVKYKKQFNTIYKSKDAISFHMNIK